MNKTGILKYKLQIVFLMLGSIGLLLISNCGKNSRNTLITKGPVNLTIDLNLPKYNHLRYPGEFDYFEGGVRGVLVIHDFDDNWYAFERTCAYQPENTCSTLHIDNNELAIRCGQFSGTVFTSCCTSLFNYAGYPSKGPASAPLARYNISRFGNTVSIYN